MITLVVSVIAVILILVIFVLAVRTAARFQMPGGSGTADLGPQPGPDAPIEGNANPSPADSMDAWAPRDEDITQQEPAPVDGVEAVGPIAPDPSRGPTSEPDSAAGAPESGDVGTVPKLASAEFHRLPRRESRHIGSSYTASGPGAVVCDGGRVASVMLRAASAIGARHASDGMLREDAYGFRTIGEHRVVLAVADGLGSTRNAHAASAMAVRVSLHVMGNAAQTDDFDWIELAQATFESVAERLAPELVDDLAETWPARPSVRSGRKEERPPATTLVVALIDVRQDGSGRLRAAAVGDSLIAFAPPGSTEWLPALATSEGPASTTSATPSLPESLAQLQTAAHDVEPGSRVLLCSDGMAETLVQGSRDGADPELARAWSTAPDLEDFLRDVRLPVPGCVDDRTALAVWLPPHTDGARW